MPHETMRVMVQEHSSLPIRVSVMQYEDKLKLLTNFTSQQSKSYFQRNTLDAFHSNFQCKKRGVDIVEQFKVIELFEREDK